MYDKILVPLDGSKLADEGGFNLVAMATHVRTGLGRWIFGSNAQKVPCEGTTPLWLVRPVKGKKKNGLVNLNIRGSPEKYLPLSIIIFPTPGKRRK